MNNLELDRVCPLVDVPAGEMRPFTVEGYSLVIINTGTDVYAMENRCPHQGAPLSEGEIVDDCVCCHEHGWLVDLDTGMVLNRDGEMAATFPVTIKDGDVYVQLG
jgi:nitrite reductase/ring-hydroxylating ferredoxin subunit